MTAPAPAIELAGLCKRYGDKTVLRDIDLGIGAGESVALLGHNGAGKTTLMKLMLGLTRPSAGRIRVLGADPAAARAHAGIGYLPESVALYDAMTGREVLVFFARLKGVPVALCPALLDRVGLTEAADRRVRTYSKGMRQRLGLAQALLGDPALLLLDEPTTGLDPALRSRFYDIVGALRESGATVLISSHALTEIEARTDRLAILKDGRLAACGTLDELRRAAGLPVQIRVTAEPGGAGAVAERLGGKVDLRKVNDSAVDLTCLGVDKMDVVRRIADIGAPVRDLEIRPPGLEEIYSHFTGEASPR